MRDDRHAEAEPTVVAREEDAPSDDEESDGEFEFPFVSRDRDAAAGRADELFAGGRIRAFYPVFGRVLDDVAAPEERDEPPRAPLGRLFQLEQARTSSVASTSSSYSSTSSSSAAELDGASPDSYCLWTPGSSPAASPSRSRLQRKSGSTGSMSRWRRIGELVVGRSHSDGREKFLFLSAPPSPARDDRHASGSNKPINATKKQQQQEPRGRGSKAVVDTLAAGRGRMPYGGGGSSSPAARRTSLPYRQHLVGLFANVQGLSRSHHHAF